MLRFLLITFCVVNGFAQEYSSLDNRVRNYPKFNSVDHLSLRIQNDFQQDTQRVRAAFIWITDNISYYESLSTFFAPKYNVVHYSDYGREYELKKYNKNQIKKIFKRKNGVCRDYSLILDYLLTSLGLESKVIYGFGKVDIMDTNGRQLYKNHTWNAVKINGEWNLMDATWASGYFNYNYKTFFKQYEEHFYFTSPSDFIKTHFPGKKEWQLIDLPISLNIFFKSPIYFPSYFKHEIKLAQGVSGSVLLSKENEAVILFEKIHDDVELYYRIGDDHQIRRLKSQKTAQNHITKIKLKKDINHTIPLTLYFKNKAVLQFKIAPSDSNQRLFENSKVKK